MCAQPHASNAVHMGVSGRMEHTRKLCVLLLLLTSLPICHCC